MTRGNSQKRSNDYVLDAQFRAAAQAFSAPVCKVQKKFLCSSALSIRSGEYLRQPARRKAGILECDKTKEFTRWGGYV